MTDQPTEKPGDGIKSVLMKRRGMMEEVKAQAELDAMPQNQVEAAVVQLETRLAKMLPTTMSEAKAGRLVNSLIQLIRSDTKGLLVQCGPSLMGGALTAAQLGLEVGTPALGEAYLIPLWNKNKKIVDPNTGRTRNGGFDAQLIIGYKGFRKLAWQSAAIKSISREIVYSNDYFERTYGSDRKIIHRPHEGGPRGDVVGYYAIVWNTMGGEVWVYMDLEEMRAHRDRFAMAKTKEGKIVGPWRDDFNSMGLKTVLKKALADSPMSIEDKLSLAVHLDQTVRTDITEDYDDPSRILGAANHLNSFTPDGVNTIDGETVEEPTPDTSQPPIEDADLEEEPPAEEPAPQPAPKRQPPAKATEEQVAAIKEFIDELGEDDYDLFLESLVGRKGVKLDRLTEAQAADVLARLDDQNKDD